MHFKANQTAAAYVAQELDEHSQEAFEIHMMGCGDCVNDVEAWRVIKTHMPDAVVVEAARQFKKHWWGGWGMAASFVGAMVVAAAGGWFANSLQRPSLDTSETSIFDLPPVTRSEECTKLPLAANTRAVVLRVTKVDSQRKLVATDDSGKELPTSRYAIRQQRDGSWVVRFDADGLQNGSAHIVARGGESEEEALGCVTGAVSPPPPG